MGAAREPARPSAWRPLFKPRPPCRTLTRRAQAAKLVAGLLEASEAMRQPGAAFNELRLLLRRNAHQLAEQAKEGTPFHPALRLDATPRRNRYPRAGHPFADSLGCADDKVDAVVEAGAVEAIVPLLTLRYELPPGVDGLPVPACVLGGPGARSGR